MLFVQYPRLIAELIFFVQDFDAKWAKTAFVVRAMTIICSLFIALFTVRLVAMFEDDHKALAILVLIIFSAVSISIDIYFTLIYFYYWKYPELRVDRSGNRPICEHEEAYEHEMGVYNTPSNAVQATDVNEFVNKFDIPNLDESSSNIITTESEQRSIKVSQKMKQLMTN